MKCPVCSAENEKDDRFCGMCGSKLQAACPQCGVRCDPSRNFCGACGAKLDKSGDEERDEVRPPEMPVESAVDWVSEFRALGWDRDVFEVSIQKDLSRDVRPGKGEGLIFAGRSSLDLHVFLRGFDASNMMPAAAFMGTSHRLIIFSLKAGSARLDPLLQIHYEKLLGVKELKDDEARKDMREVDGLLRLSLRQQDEPLDILVLNKNARAPFLRFLQTASSTGINAPTEPRQAKAQPLLVEDRAKRAQGAAMEARQSKPAPRGTAGFEVKSDQGQHSRALRIAATVLGIIGGVAGGIGATIAIVIGGIGTAFGDTESSSIAGLGYVALFLAIVGVVGGAIAIPKPKLAGVFMLVSGIGGTIAVSLGFAFGGALLVVGGILALVGARRPRTA